MGLARAAATLLDVEFQVGVTVGGVVHCVDGSLAERGAPEVGVDDDAGGVYHGLGARTALAGCLLRYADGDLVCVGGVFTAADAVPGMGNLLTDEVHQPVALVEDGQPLKLAGSHDAFDAREIAVLH